MPCILSQLYRRRWLLIALVASACQSQPSPNAETSLSSAELRATGDSITTQVQAALLREVSAAKADGGITHAVEYCQLRALPLVDSLSEQYRVQIRRVSDRYRNSIDRPDTLEARLLETYLSSPDQRTSQLVTNEEATHYFKPIVIGMPACLSCHGQIGQDILPDTYRKIRALYPNDRATGYQMGDVRGMWHLRFPNHRE